MRNEPTLTDVEAQAAINAVRDQLRSENIAAVVAVADSAGELVALLRLAGAKRAPIQVAINKAFTAARERCPTIDIGRNARSADRGFDIAYYGDPRYVGWGGGVPVIYEGAVVGAVGVSGLHEQEDMRMAAVGVAAILGTLGRGARSNS
jgi:glc operon protein GlcG